VEVAVPIYGEAKLKQIARSVLPAKARARSMARDRRRAIHQGARSYQRDRLAVMARDDSFDDRAPVTLNAHYAPLGGTRELVSSRRAADKLGPLLRWGERSAPKLGATPAERVAAVRAVLPQGVIGDHALSHLQWVDPFIVDDAPRRRRQNSLRGLQDRARAEQSLRDRLTRRLRGRLDAVGELNRLIKDDWYTHSPGSDERPRLLAGPHDVEALAEWVVRHIGRGQRCPNCRLYHEERREPQVVLAFCGLDPNDPYCDYRARQRR
jgi:hypothetical protein